MQKIAKKIAEDAIAYNRDDKKFYLNKFVNREYEYMIWKYQVLLRKEEICDLNGYRIISTYYLRKKNRLGERLGFTIPKNTFGAGMHIWHYGNIIVNAFAKIGKNFNLHDAAGAIVNKSCLESNVILAGVSSHI